MKIEMALYCLFLTEVWYMLNVKINCGSQITEKKLKLLKSGFRSNLPKLHIKRTLAKIKNLRRQFLTVFGINLVTI